jgi:hypothetical protein
MNFKPGIILTIIIVKVTLFFFMTLSLNTHRAEKLDGLFFENQGETWTYFPPIENLLKGEGYSNIDNSDGEFKLLPSTRRMPGLIPIYMPLRLLFSEIVSKNILILLQFVLSVISIFCLGKIIYQFTASNIASTTGMFIYTISSFVSVFDNSGLPESLSVSMSIFSIWLYIKAAKNTHVNLRLLFAAGILLTWTIFLRPATGILAPILALDLWRKTNLNHTFFQSFKFQSLLFSTFIIALSVWTVRNYIVSDKLIVLEDSVFDSMPHIYTPAEKGLRPLINHWGGQRKYFYPNTMGAYFYGQTNDISIFPEAVFENSFTIDSLAALRQLFQEAHSNPNSIAEKSFLIKSEFLRNSYKEMHPIKYYIEAPIKSLFRFYFIKTIPNLPFPPLNEMNLFHKIMKAGNILLYNLIALSAILGLIVYTKKRGEFRILLLFPFLYCFALACVLYNTEVRYLVSAFPFLIVVSSIGFNALMNKIRILKRHD